MDLDISDGSDSQLTGSSVNQWRGVGEQKGSERENDVRAAQISEVTWVERNNQDVLAQSDTGGLPELQMKNQHYTFSIR